MVKYHGFVRDIGREAFHLKGVILDLHGFLIVTVHKALMLAIQPKQVKNHKQRGNEIHTLSQEMVAEIIHLLYKDFT